MPLIAFRASDGSEVESFSVGEAQWNAMRKMPLGTFLMPATRWPAVPKRSNLGLQFFAHAPGFTGAKPEPESANHRLAKVSIVRALRAAGFTAWVERSGQSSDGERWQADVVCQVGGRLIAFEVQLSQQTVDDYEARSARYVRSGVECIWLVREARHFKALGNAISSRAIRQGEEPPIRPQFSLKDMALIPLTVGPERAPQEIDQKVKVISDFAPQAVVLSVGEFAVGTVGGKLKFNGAEWRWV